MQADIPTLPSRFSCRTSKKIPIRPISDLSVRQYVLMAEPGDNSIQGNVSAQ
jgi:hypothetical protein